MKLEFLIPKNLEKKVFYTKLTLVDENKVDINLKGAKEYPIISDKTVEKKKKPNLIEFNINFKFNTTSFLLRGIKFKFKLEINYQNETFLNVFSLYSPSFYVKSKKPPKNKVNEIFKCTKFTKKYTIFKIFDPLLKKKRKFNENVILDLNLEIKKSEKCSEEISFNVLENKQYLDYIELVAIDTNNTINLINAINQF
jgi:hypothetical protein